MLANFINLLQTYLVYSVKLHPIILVPGDGGSQIEAKINRSHSIHFWCYDHTDWFDLWLNIGELLPPAVYCWEQNIRLRYDRRNRTTSNTEGVQTRIPGFGGTFTVEYLDKSKGSVGYYFNSVVDSLVSKLGYKRGIDIHGAPYDFRKAANEHQDYFKQLQKLIETSYKMNGKKPVILISHSMGSIMTLKFLQSQTQAWKNKYIVRFISIAGVWAGTAQSIRVFAEGTNLNSRFLSEKHLLWERTCPSLAWLMPNSKKWNDKEDLVVIEGMHFSRKNVTKFFKMLSQNEGTNFEYMMDDTKNLVNISVPPHVELDCIHSSLVPTPEKLSYPSGYFPYYDPNIVYGDGDGTVNIRSLETCLDWKGKQKQAIHYTRLAGLDHLDMLRDKHLVHLITKKVRHINGI